MDFESEGVFLLAMELTHNVTFAIEPRIHNRIFGREFFPLFCGQTRENFVRKHRDSHTITATVKALPGSFAGARRKRTDPPIRFVFDAVG
ncbi:MAG: hypothetical protein AAFX06_13900, partial [Planctomycetota bacterium]